MKDDYYLISKEDLDARKAVSRGSIRIRDERLRQLEVEGWTPKHDDQWAGGQLAVAALAYLQHYVFGILDDKTPKWWPIGWNVFWFKPTTAIRNLEKAGALIAAEIDRLLRLEDKNEVKEKT